MGTRDGEASSTSTGALGASLLWSRDGRPPQDADTHTPPSVWRCAGLQLPPGRHRGEKAGPGARRLPPLPGVGLLSSALPIRSGAIKLGDLLIGVGISILALNGVWQSVRIRRLEEIIEKGSGPNDALHVGRRVIKNRGKGGGINQ